MKKIKKVPKPRKPYVKNLVGSKIAYTRRWKRRKLPLEVKELGETQETPEVKELCVGIFRAMFLGEY